MKCKNTYTILYENRTDYLYVHLEGPESYDAAVNFWENLAIKARNESIKKIMIVDEVTGQLTALEHFNLSIIIAALFSRIKIAFIDPKEHTFELNKFGEAVVFSRGGKALVCRSESEGLVWLLNET